MKFGFKFGKSKVDTPPEEAGAEIVDELIQSVEEEGTAVKPHAPLQELSLDVEQELETGEALIPEVEPVEADGETVKLVEVKIDAAAAPPPPAPAAANEKKDTRSKPGDPLDISASISSIFTDVEEEDNPLANLIKALPDVTATELMDDLNEINGIIKGWKKH